MKTYRLITLTAAVLITLLIARFLTDKKVVVSPPDQVHAVQDAP
jgi:hypothetical protein